MNRCGGCGGPDGVQGFTIGATLCMGCRRERHERRVAYRAAQRKQERETTIMVGFMLAIFVLMMVAMLVTAVTA